MTQETNWAEFERKVFEGDLTLAQCERMGSTHKAYGWSCTPYGSWNAEQRAAYRKGYEQ